MARRRLRRRSRKLRNISGIVAVVAAVFVFKDAWLGVLRPAEAPAGKPEPPRLTSDRPETSALDGGPYADVPERGSDPLDSGSTSVAAPDPQRAAGLVDSARRALEAGDRVLARAHYSESLLAGLPPKGELEARTELRKLGRETIFSSAIVKGDPYSAGYVIAVGDNMAAIARRFGVTPELLARINNITDVNRIQAGRRIKVVQGPFHVRVGKSTHTLDVYLEDTFVDHFKVGLGADDSTPVGDWVVKNKLKNPTYYPPRGAERIVSADDPENPLGERWIGLEGVGGGAIGQMRYGIHGTIEPESIGKDASMGCIRLHNEDVELLYDLLIVGKSRVVIEE